MSKTVKTHQTGNGEIVFMAVGRPLLNKYKGKEEYSAKLKFQKSSEQAMQMYQLLLDVNSRSVLTPTNAKLDGEFIINFTSEFAPVVTQNGITLEGHDIPFFDGRIDKGIANVTFKVITYDNKTTVVRLGGIDLIDLNLAPREQQGDSLEVTKNKLDNLG